MTRNKTAFNARKARRRQPLSLADTGGNDFLKGRGGNDVLSARNGNDRLSGGGGDDLLISYSDSGEPAVLGKQVVNQNEPLSASRDILRGGRGADTFMWALEIDAKPEFLKKHTQADGRINGANNALAGENNNSHDHWLEGIGRDVIADFNLEEGDKIVINGHTVENYKIDKKGKSYVLNLRSNQGNADQNNPNGAHDGDLVGSIKIRGAAAKYSEQQIRNAISLDNMVNYVADGRGIEVVNADTTANRNGIANAGKDKKVSPIAKHNLRIQAEDMKLYGAYKVESVPDAEGDKVISLLGGPNDETGEAKFKFKGAEGQYKVKLGYFDENDGVGKLELMKGENQLVSLNLDQSLGSRLADKKTMTSYTLSNVNISSGDIFTIKGYENGSSATAEHARVDYLEFIPMGGMSDSANSEMMKPMGMDFSMAASTTVGSDLPMVGTTY